MSTRFMGVAANGLSYPFSMSRLSAVSINALFRVRRNGLIVKVAVAPRNIGALCPFHVQRDLFDTRVCTYSAQVNTQRQGIPWLPLLED